MSGPPTGWRVVHPFGNGWGRMERCHTTSTASWSSSTEATQRLVRTVDGLHGRRLGGAVRCSPAGRAPTWSPTSRSTPRGSPARWPAWSTTRSAGADVRLRRGPRRRHRRARPGRAAAELRARLHGRSRPGSPTPPPRSPRTRWSTAIERTPGGRTFPAAVHRRDAAARGGDPPRRPRAPATRHRDWPPEFSGAAPRRDGQAGRLARAVPGRARPTSTGPGRSARAARPSSGPAADLGLVADRPAVRGRTDQRQRRTAEDRGMVTYTGDVKPGGAADIRELSVLTVTKVAVDPEMSNNCYLLRCNATGDQVLIDAAAEPDDPAATDRRRRAGRRRDHPPALGPPPRARRRGGRHRSHRRGRDAGRRRGHRADRRPRRPGGSGDGDTVAVGDVHARGDRRSPATPPARSRSCTTTPSGHPHLFTGDSLFPGGVGATFGDAEAFAQLIDDVSSQALRPAPRRHLVLPRPRQRLDPRRRAAAPRGVARAGLVGAS